MYHANTSQKKTGMAILISDKVYFRTRRITRDKEEHNIMMKGSINQKDKTVLYVHAQTKTLKYTKQKLMKLEEIDLKILVTLKTSLSNE